MNKPVGYTFYCSVLTKTIHENFNGPKLTHMLVPYNILPNTPLRFEQRNLEGSNWNINSSY